VIFVDASVPRTVADAIKRVRPDARWKLDLFPHDTKDEVWLEAAGKQGWLVVTRDKHVRTRPGERRAIEEHGVGCFILGYKQDLKKEEVTEIVLGALEHMEELFERTERPFIYTITKSGDFKRRR
jgi:predicted nuclease of predicted toxin-antitoxin system